MTVTIPTMAMTVYNDFTDEDDGDHDDGVPSEHDDQRNQNNLINNGNSEDCYANDEENNDKTTVSITVYYSTRVNSKFLICIGSYHFFFRCLLIIKLPPDPRYSCRTFLTTASSLSTTGAYVFKSVPAARSCRMHSTALFAVAQACLLFLWLEQLCVHIVCVCVDNVKPTTN